MKRQLYQIALGVFLMIGVGATTADAAPITCGGLKVSGSTSTYTEGTVDPAIQCVGIFEGVDAYPGNETRFGFTWLAQDKDNGDTQNGATEAALTLTGNGGFSGEFTVDPSASQCGLVDCNQFMILLKWDNVRAYWDLGQLLAPATFGFDWSVTEFALSHATLYARFEEEDDIVAPEPAVVALFGIGLLAIGFQVRRKKARQKQD